MELDTVILVLVQVSGLLFVLASMVAMGLSLTIPAFELGLERPADDARADR